MMRKLLVLLTLLLALTLGSSWASQSVGAHFNYQPWLGLGMARFGSTELYWPFAVIWWVGHGLYAYAPATFDAAFVKLVIVWVSAIGVVFALNALLRPVGAVKEFGVGAWGTLWDAYRAGIWRFRLSELPGIVLGRWRTGRSDNRILTYSGPEHHLITGASRAGKGVGHVIPTLLSWPESAFVYDPKEECYDITAAFRRSHIGHSFFLNFTRKDSARYNPLFEIRRGAGEISDTQNVAGMLVDPSGTQNKLDFFQTSAKELLTAIILHVLYNAPLERKNLAEVRRCVLDSTNTLLSMSQVLHLGDAPHPEVRLIGERYAIMENKVRDSILATCSTCLELYADPTVAELTSHSDFLIGDLVCSRLPVTCYLQAPPSDATRLRPLTRLILSQVAQALTMKLDTDSRGRKKRHKLLYLIDEFPTLGRLGFFSTNLRIMAGYGIKAMIIVQSFKDIVEAYGPYNTIIDNCHVIVAFATADTDTAKRISEMAGQKTEKRRSESYHLGAWMRGSYNYQEVRRTVLEPGDVRMLPYDEQLVFVTGSKPFRTRKIRYFEEPLYKARATDIRKGKSGPSQTNGAGVPRKTVAHDWAKITGTPAPRRPQKPQPAAPPSSPGPVFTDPQPGDQA
jgi:type IV secretion system protein VirD4